MPITFIGNIEKRTTRFETGMWSFDRSLANRVGDIGIPVRGIMEISGNSGIGKSTMIYSLSGMLANYLKGFITIADIEDHLDPDYVEIIMSQHGYEGTVKIEEGELDNKKLDALLDTLSSDKYAVGIVDSIGGISPVSESEGGMEDANMGRRARMVAILARKIIHLASLRKSPFLVFAANHVHQIIGSRGTLTSGGVVKDYLSTTRIRLTKQDESEYGILLKGKVTKNTFGYSGRIFYMYNLYGVGVHTGITAVQDCIMSGKATNSKVVKLGDKSYGYMKHIIQKHDDPELFQPFKDALKDAKEVLDSGDESE